jgi:hypothetical protein
VESFDFFHPLLPGCDGRADCAGSCPYDALHLVRGPLVPPGAAPESFASLDDEAQPCHGWARAQPGYVGTYCGALANGSEAALLGGGNGSRTLSLVFCSDRSVHFAGFRVRAAAANCPANCSARGRCVDYACVCPPGWAGPACEARVYSCFPPPAPCPAGPNASCAAAKANGGGSAGGAAAGCPSDHFVCTGPDDDPAPAPARNGSASAAAPATAAAAGGGGGRVGRCECAVGYYGEACDDAFCAGAVTLQARAGTLRDHADRCAAR